MICFQPKEYILVYRIKIGDNPGFIGDWSPSWSHNQTVFFFGLGSSVFPLCHHLEADFPCMEAILIRSTSRSRHPLRWCVTFLLLIKCSDKSKWSRVFWVTVPGRVHSIETPWLQDCRSQCIHSHEAESGECLCSAHCLLFRHSRLQPREWFYPQ